MPSPLRLAPRLILGSIILLLSGAQLGAGEPAPSVDEAKSVRSSGRSNPAVAKDANPNESKGKGNSSASSKPKYPPFAEFMQDARPIDGLIKLYRKEEKLYGELTPQILNQDLIVLISIAKGIGQSPLLGGMSWGFGDDGVWQFRKVADRIQLVRRNVRFTAKAGSPEREAVERAYTDSVLFSLPIATVHSGAYIVDLGPIFMSDLPQISRVLKGFSFSAAKSTWAAIKAYRDNVELQVAATYASGGTTQIESVADSRGVTVNVHYSISKLPKAGSYQPRRADDRVGYFLSVIKDYSREGEGDRFVRYINRWDLRKADEAAEVSPPRKPIVFWLEKTVPFRYRKPIADGIREWNNAFEKAGFYDAIQVRQQSDDATWDPEDINYNTFRWITSSAGFAMGPSRVDPTTGQILDADIIFDADFLQYWTRTYETFTPEGIEIFTGGPVDLEGYAQEQRRTPDHLRGHRRCKCEFFHGLGHEIAMGAAVMASRRQSEEDLEKLIMQGLKEVTMHEVGHTLGLRHNFKSSTAFTLSELNDPQKTAITGLSSSVMDYTPANLVPEDTTQGDYFSTTIGPYDAWAIQYGYQPVSGGASAVAEALGKIAARSAEPELAYATDEDTRGIDPDPLSNRWDLGSDGLGFARRQAQLVQEAWPDLVDRTTEEGKGYEQARRAFGVLLMTHGRAMFVAARFVGGLYTSRSHHHDPHAKAPFEVVDAQRQRDALALLEQEMFTDEPFRFPPEMINYLGASRWSHWGTDLPLRVDYPLHATILMWQTRILSQLLSPLTLERLHDSELKVPSDQDAFTTAELIQRLAESIYSEVRTISSGEFTNRKPAISSLRRNLQRTFLNTLSRIALGTAGAPEDCRSIAYVELGRLAKRIRRLLDRNEVSLDSYSRAHLEETASRIDKVLDARIALPGP